MVKIVLVSDNKNTVDEVKSILEESSYEIINVDSEESAKENIENISADLVLFDCEVKKTDIISVIRKTKLAIQTRDIRSVLLLPEKNINYDILKYFNDYITRPIDKNLFISTIVSNLQLRDTFRVLSKNNNDLAKSLYQLNVLYTTGTQLAGSLDKTKLIEIMTDGLEQSLSLTLCYALILNEVNDIKLIIKSVISI